MPDITDPQVIKFCNDDLRPVAEQLEALQAKINSLAAKYTTVIAPALNPHANGDPVIDNREHAGVTQVTKLDILRMASLLNSMSQALGAANVEATIARMAVHTLNVQVQP